MVKSILVIAVLTLGLVSAQDVCSKARDCKKVAFVYAFTQDTDPDRINADEADKIKADVRKCFMPCAESARKIAKLQVAAGDPLFDKSSVKTNARGRGRINTPANPWEQASRVQLSQANGKVALAVRRTQSSPRRFSRQVSSDDSCISKVLGKSAFEFLQECETTSSSVLSPATSTRPSVTKGTTTSFLSGIRSQFNRGRGRGRGKRQTKKFNGKADANGELLYMFAYSNEIATRMCPDKRASILQCVNTATKGRVNLNTINANTVKSRYCQVEADCEKKKNDCVLSLAQAQQKSCGCTNQLKAKVGGACELPPSPCDDQFQSDPPRRDNSGDVCQADVPTSSEILAQLRKKHGAGDYQLQADARKEKKNNGQGKNSNRNTTRGRPVTQTTRVAVTTTTKRPSPFDRINNLFSRGRGGK